MRPKIQNLLAEFRLKLRLQLYAASSIATYSNALPKFLTAFPTKNLEQLSVQHIAGFLATLQQKNQLSPAYQRQILAAITKFYQLRYNRRNGFIGLVSQAKSKAAPEVFNRDGNQTFVFPLS